MFSTSARTRVGAPSRLLSIQYLRAVAVLMVIGYHACLFGWRTGFEIGAAGVDVFFVISGFILWTIAHERPLPAGRFLLRRLERVAPLYWIVTLVVAIIGWIWPGAIFDADPKPASHLILSLSFIGHLNPSGRPNPVLPVGWSLNDEALFYVVFALCLLAPARRRFAVLAAGLLGVVGLAIIDPPLYYLDYSLILLQFLAGAWLAQLRLASRLPSFGWGVFMLLWGVVLFAILDPLNLYETLSRPFTWGLPALALVAGGVTVEARRPLPDVKPFRFLGDASYSLYLVHWPVMSLLGLLMHRSHLAYLPVAMGASLAVGIVMHLWVERPLLRMFRERLGGAALPSRST